MAITKERAEIHRLMRAEEKQTKRVKIAKSGSQFVVRIPKAIALEASIDLETDRFEFSIEVPYDPRMKVRLTGVLVRKNE